MPATVTGVGPVCNKKDCSCYEPQFAFRFTPLIQLILLQRNGHTYLLMERFLLTPTPSPLFIFCLPLFPMWPQTRVSLSAEAPGKHLLRRLPWLAHSKNIWVVCTSCGHVDKCSDLYRADKSIKRCANVQSWNWKWPLFGIDTKLHWNNLWNSNC